MYQLHHLRVGKVPAKAADDPHVRTAPAIDRLIVVAHHAEVASRARERAHEAILSEVGVLELVDQHVAKALAKIAPRGAVLALGDAHAEDDQILEVHGVGGLERAFVALEQVDELGVEPALPIHVSGALTLALLCVDLREHPARWHAALVERAFLEQARHDGLLVRLVVDHELRAEPDLVVVAPEQARAHRMEGARPEIARHLRSRQLLQAVLELARRLVGERDGQDAVRRNPMHRQQRSDAVGDDAGLPAPRAREHEQRPLGVARGGGLIGIQLRGSELGHRRRRSSSGARRRLGAAHTPSLPAR